MTTRTHYVQYTDDIGTIHSTDLMPRPLAFAKARAMSRKVDCHHVTYVLTEEANGHACFVFGALDHYAGDRV